MTSSREFLNPRQKLVDGVADWLCSRIETDVTGARSLSHVLVVVPTLQSGRSLRLRLSQVVSERFGGAGVLPPSIKLPMQLVVPDSETATPLQLRAAFLKFMRERPKRHVEEGRTILDEWHTLFWSEYITDVRSHLSFFDQLSDIWRILAANGMLMSDVAGHHGAQEMFADAYGDEELRWQELGEFETAYFDYLHGIGLRHEAEAIHLAKTSAPSVPDGIREIVLPSLADPLPVLYDVLNQQNTAVKVTVLLHADECDADKFDEWGRPRDDKWTGSAAPVIDGIRDCDVIRAGTDAELASRVAADFPVVGSGLAVPSLGLCDAKIFPELVAAFLNGGRELHNSERHSLSASSLGDTVALFIDIFAAYKTDGVPWDAFAALFRQDDVMSFLLRAVPKKKNAEKRTRVEILSGMNICRNTYLPHFVPKDLEFDLSRLRRFEIDAFDSFHEAALVLASVIDAAYRESGAKPSGFVREMLTRMYAGRTIKDEEKEFKAAANLVRELLGQMEDPKVASLGLADGAMIGLFRKALSDAAYSLEPDDPNAVRTEGWLELAWSASDKIALVGFNEGSVPDAVVGHAFLPDALREKLGLTTNKRRLARDTFLLSDILKARSSEDGSVRAYISQTNNAGDIHRPSRLLFMVPDDRLATRAKALFGPLPPRNPLPPRKLLDAWRPRLREEIEVYGKREKCPDGRLSASSIDLWLKCPFTYRFTYGEGMNRVDEKTELEATDFGTLIHRALELYAREQLERTKNGLAQLHETADIEKSLKGIMRILRNGYGANPSVNMRLQLDAAEGRLMIFARLQSKWAQDGWTIAAEPEYHFEAKPFEGEKDCDVPIHGSIDRIDWKEGVGYRIIDYKVWDSRKSAQGRILKGGVAEATHAARLGLPVLSPDDELKKQRRFMTVQLPLYGRCIEKQDADRFSGKIADYCYVILGATENDCVVLGSRDNQRPFEAVNGGKKVAIADHVELVLDTARTAIRRIKEGIFWPPGPGGVWKRDVKDIIAFSPEKDFPPGTPWRDSQERKLESVGREVNEVAT